METQESMNMTRAVMRCLKEKYATFRGRASRSEYWWFTLAVMLVSIAAGGCCWRLCRLSVRWCCCGGMFRRRSRERIASGRNRRRHWLNAGMSVIVAVIGAVRPAGRTLFCSGGLQWDTEKTKEDIDEYNQ